MRAKLVLEEIRFNFDKPAPYKKYQVKERIPGQKGPMAPNPRKSKYGKLTPEEEEIRDKFAKKLESLQDEVGSLEYEREDLENELKELTSNPFSEEELEQFYADVINDFGEKALDILNSGLSLESKFKSLDALNPKQDIGFRDLKALLNNYQYYHPEDSDPKMIEKIEKRINAINNVIKEREGMIDRLETKIYNIENY